MKKFGLNLTDADRASLDSLVQTVWQGNGSWADAVRYSIRRQAGRGNATRLKALYAEVKESIKADKRWVRSNQRQLRDSGHTRMKPWCQAFEGEDFAAVEKVMADHGFTIQAEAIRFCLRVQARLEAARATI